MIGFLRTPPAPARGRREQKLRPSAVGVALACVLRAGLQWKPCGGQPPQARAVRSHEEVAAEWGIDPVTLRRKLRGIGWQMSDLPVAAEMLGIDTVTLLERVVAVMRGERAPVNRTPL